MEHVNACLRDIPRDNDYKKAAGLVSNIGELVAEISHMEGILASRSLRYLIFFNHTLERVPFRVALLILLILVLFYGTKEAPFEGHEWAFYLVEGLSFLQLGGSVLFSATYFVVTAPIAMHKAKLKTEKKARNTLQNSARLMNAAALTAKTSRGRREPQAEYDEQYHEPPPAPSKDGAESVVCDVFKASLVSYGAWWHVAFLTLGVLAFWPNNLEWRFLYALHMLEYFRLPEGKSIVESIRVGGPGLLKSAQGGLVVILMAASLSWMVFRGNISHFHACDTAYQCVSRILNAGIKGDLTPAFGDPNIANLYPAWGGHPASTYPMEVDDILDIQAGQYFPILASFDPNP